MALSDANYIDKDQIHFETKMEKNGKAMDFAYLLKEIVAFRWEI